MESFGDISDAFQILSDEKKAAQMSAYMRNQFRFFGIQTPKRRSVYKSLITGDLKTGKPDWSLLDKCWEDEHREFQYFVVDYLSGFKKILTFADIPRLERYVRTKQWWDTIDGLHSIFGNIGLSDKRIDRLMLEWAEDKDFWVRRIAIDHQLQRKELTDTVLLERILQRNLGSREFFINKAIGWSLREYSKTDAEWVRGFMERNREKMSPLSIREGSKYI